MIVLGIDPGTAITGYGFIQEIKPGELQAIRYGIITTPAGEPLERRLFLLHQQLREILLLHRPHTSAVENLFFQRNVKTALAVGHARGVVLLTLAEFNIEVKSYSPNEIKQAVTGYGAADKNQIQFMVRNLLNLPEMPKPDDAADALAIAICHFNSRHWNSIVAD